MHILPTAFKSSKLQEEEKKQQQQKKPNRLENIKTECYQTQS